MEEFSRIKRLPPYVFEQVNKIKAQERAKAAAEAAAKAPARTAQN